MSDPSYLFLIGAPKAGTTSIAAAFAQSSDVAVSRVKEPCYFTDFVKVAWQGPRADALRRGLVGDWASYDALFGEGRWRLDASTDYLGSPVAAERLAAFAQDHRVKVVAVLRDPVARIVSEFQHTLRDAYQTGTLAQSLAAEGQRTADNWHPLFRHIARSRYAAPIQRYRAAFGDDFLLLDFHAQDGAARIAEFIGVDAPDTVPRANESFAPRFPGLNRLMQADGLRNAVRRIVPEGARGAVRQRLERANATRYVPTENEIATIRAALADDIAWCLADPDVPTDHWTLAKG